MAKCPHCKGDVSIKDVGKESKGIGIFKQETLYSCPHCKCVLGFSRGKFTG